MSRLRWWAIATVWAVGVAAVAHMVTAFVLSGWETAAIVADIIAAIAAVVGTVLSVHVLLTNKDGVVLAPPKAGDPEHWMVPRDEVDQVVHAACGEGRRTVGIVAGLHGGGGVGKTVVARLVSKNKQIEKRFGSRVYFVTIGRGVRTRSEIAAKVAQEFRRITGRTIEGQDPVQMGMKLGEWLERRPLSLLILDDVWAGEQLEPFLQGARDRCVRLVTTRNPDVLPADARRITVDRMTDKQAREVLKHQLGDQLPGACVEELLAATGRWALLLRLTNEYIRTLTDTGIPAADAASQLLARLRRHGPASFDPAKRIDLDDPRERNRAVGASISAAIDNLVDQGEPWSLDARERFSELAVFAENEAVPVRLVALLWKATSGKDEFDSRVACERMARLSLLTLTTDVEGGAVIVHDVIRDYLQTELGDRRAATNAALCRAIADELPAVDPAQRTPGPRLPWWTVGNGGFLHCAASSDYVMDHLVEHLIDAGWTKEAEALATDVRWMLARLRQRGPNAVASDLELAGTPGTLRFAADVARAAHLLGPTDPSHSLEAILCNRLGPLRRWKSVFASFSPHKPALCNAWLPPDLPDPALKRTLTGHSGAARFVAFSADGTRLITGDDEGTVRHWSTSTGQLLQTFTGPSHELQSVAFSADGSRLGGANDRGSVRLWNVASGELLSKLTGPVGPVKSLSVSLDATRVATVVEGFRVCLWDATSGVLKKTCTTRVDDMDLTGTDSARRMNLVVLSPDGACLATGDNVGRVHLWNAASGRSQGTLPAGFRGAVRSMAFSPDGTRLAAGGRDGTVRIWDAADRKLLHTFRGLTSPVWSVAFSPDGTRLAAGANDGTVRLWDATTGTPLRTFSGHNSSVVSIAFSADNAYLATGDRDGSVRLWDAATGERVRATAGLNGPMTAVAVKPSGAFLAVASASDVRLLDAATGALLDTLHAGSSEVKSLAFSPDGSWLAAGGHDGAVRLWDATTGEYLRRIDGASGPVCSVTPSPDAACIAACYANGSVRLWDAATGALQRTLHSPDSVAEAVVFSPDGRRLATRDASGFVRLWDATTGSQSRTLSVGTHAVKSVTFSPDGSWLAGGAHDGTICVWDAATGEVLHSVTSSNGPVCCVTFSPDGSWLAAVTRTGAVEVRTMPTLAAAAMTRVDDALVGATWSLRSQTMYVVGSAGLHSFAFAPQEDEAADAGPPAAHGRATSDVTG